MLYKTSNIKPSKHVKTETRKSFANVLLDCEESTTLADEFMINDIEVVLKTVKNGKAAEADGILPEFIKKVRS